MRRGLEVVEREVVRAPCAAGCRAAAPGPTRSSGSAAPPASCVGDEVVERRDVGVRRPGPVTMPVRRSSVSHSCGTSVASSGGRVVGHVAHGELVEREVVVRALERRRAGQDHVGVARRLVDVDVERDHAGRARRAPPSSRSEFGVEQARVAAQREQRADLALAGRLDLLGERGDGQLAERPRAGRARGSSSGPVRKPRAGASGSALVWPAAASGNIAPPSRSRLPVSALSTSTSQLASVPNSCVVVPMRP